jgi:5'-phosphate synthase pdxT subunit
MATATTAIGILDLQGGVVEHLDHLQRLGIPGVRVKRPDELAGLAGLILPGGESSCLARLMRIFELDLAIRREFERGLKLWGTCAGAILLAKHIVGEPPHLGLIDLEVQRNAYGSQLDSFKSEAWLPAVAAASIPLTFIRAPKITRVGADISVLLRHGDAIAAAESSQVLVTTFHPELTGSLAFHRYFARKSGLRPRGGGEGAEVDPSWDRTSWTQQALP